MTSAAYPPDVMDDVAEHETEYPSEAGRVAVARFTAPVVELASPNDIQTAMMQLDEQALLSEIMGEALEKWFYSFNVSGKMVEGVSCRGAHEFARMRADKGYPIRFPTEGIRYEEATENGELGVRCFVVARDARTKQEAIGMAFYPYHTVANGQRVFDKFAGRKAMSVAERNAILRLVPEHIIVAALKMRATIVAQNELALAERARQAMLSRPEAPRALAGAPLNDPYATPSGSSAPAVIPPCPACGGEMWDNRLTRKNPNSPDFKCKAGPRARGGEGCPGVIWPPKNGATPKQVAAPKGATSTTDAELPLEGGRSTTTKGTDALREG